uniref:LigA n=1 Tax=Parastrongyloides trichosuri TaxID=131310 RepID=A0A0N5A095_PARTI
MVQSHQGLRIRRARRSGGRYLRPRRDVASLRSGRPAAGRPGERALRGGPQGAGRGRYQTGRAWSVGREGGHIGLDACLKTAVDGVGEADWQGGAELGEEGRQFAQRRARNEEDVAATQGQNFAARRAQIQHLQHAQIARPATDQGAVSSVGRRQGAPGHDQGLIGVNRARHVEHAGIAHLAVDPDLQRAGLAQRDFDFGAQQVRGITGRDIALKLRQAALGGGHMTDEGQGDTAVRADLQLAGQFRRGGQGDLDLVAGIEPVVGLDIGPRREGQVTRQVGHWRRSPAPISRSSPSGWAFRPSCSRPRSGWRLWWPAGAHPGRGGPVSGSERLGPGSDPATAHRAREPAGPLSARRPAGARDRFQDRPASDLCRLRHGRRRQGGPHRPEPCLGRAGDHPHQRPGRTGRPGRPPGGSGSATVGHARAPDAPDRAGVAQLDPGRQPRGGRRQRHRHRARPAAVEGQEPEGAADDRRFPVRRLHRPVRRPAAGAAAAGIRHARDPEPHPQRAGAGRSARQEHLSANGWPVGCVGAGPGASRPCDPVRRRDLGRRRLDGSARVRPYGRRARTPSGLADRRRLVAAGPDGADRRRAGPVRAPGGVWAGVAGR